jgi:hypothetical protein
VLKHGNNVQTLSIVQSLPHAEMILNINGGMREREREREMTRRYEREKER